MALEVVTLLTMDFHVTINEHKEEILLGSRQEIDEVIGVPNHDIGCGPFIYIL